MFIIGSCAHFGSFGIHNSMNEESAIEKLQQIAKEKEAQKSEHKQTHEEEVKLLKKMEKEGVLNIQLLVIWSLPHSSSSSKCAKGKVYNLNVQFAQTIT
jgi:hypothetical protein